MILRWLTAMTAQHKAEAFGTPPNTFKDVGAMGTPYFPEKMGWGLLNSKKGSGHSPSEELY